MHPKSLHNNPYDFDALTAKHQDLKPFVFVTDFGNKSIDFSNSEAVFHLNKALLKLHYQLTDWNIPKHYLCPPIPGRTDYIHYIADLLADTDKNTRIKGLDIGVGANCIYPLLGSQLYQWKMVGSDINTDAITAAQANVNATEGLEKNIEIRHQTNNANLFEGIVREGEQFHFSMCNPPFHPSKEEATKSSFRKLKNLRQAKAFTLNFGGQANELWCNGGETLFIKRMIKQSVAFKT